MKKISIVLMVSVVSLLTLLGQSAVLSDGGSGGMVSTPVVIDPMQVISRRVAIPFVPVNFTNRAEIASIALQRVSHIRIGIYNNANTDTSVADNLAGGDHAVILPFNHPVKSFSAMQALVNQQAFSFKVFDSSMPTYVSVDFLAGDPTKGGGDWTDSQILFSGSNGGGLALGNNGVWSLGSKDSRIQMRLNPSLRVFLPGVVSAKAIHRDTSGNITHMERLWRNADGTFGYPVNIAGTGVLVLTGDFGGRGNIETYALDMKTGKELPLKGVLINALLEGSDEIYSYVDPVSVEITQESYFRYGINPLIIIKNTRAKVEKGEHGTVISLKLASTEGYTPTSLQIVDIANGTKWFVTPDKGQPAQILFPNGEFHIIPNQFLGGRVGLEAP